MELQKVALVTGVTRETGLGLETARQLIDLKYKVIVGGRNLMIVHKLASKIKAVAKQVDITEEVSIKQLVQEIKRRTGNWMYLLTMLPGILTMEPIHFCLIQILLRRIQLKYRETATGVY